MSSSASNPQAPTVLLGVGPFPHPAPSKADLDDRFEVAKELSPVPGAAALATYAIYVVKDMQRTPPVDAVVKLLKPEKATDSDAKARITQESEILKALQQLGFDDLVPGHIAGGSFRGPGVWFAMDRIEGRTLEDCVVLGPLSHAERDRLVGLFIHFLRRLHELHSSPLALIHRDIKPSNIMLVVTKTGELVALVLLDFGSAKCLTGKYVAVTKHPILAPCTSPYAASEQLGGGEGKVGPWTDVHAAGVTLYFVLAGVLPEGSANLGTALTQTRPALARYAEPLSRATECDPAHRYRTAAEFADALERAHRRPQSRWPSPRLFWAAVSVLAVVLPAALFAMPPAPSSGTDPARTRTETAREEEPPRTARLGGPLWLPGLVRSWAPVQAPEAPLAWRVEDGAGQELASGSLTEFARFGDGLYREFWRSAGGGGRPARLAVRAARGWETILSRFPLPQGLSYPARTASGPIEDSTSPGELFATVSRDRDQALVSVWREAEAFVLLDQRQVTVAQYRAFLASPEARSCFERVVQEVGTVPETLRTPDSYLRGEPGERVEGDGDDRKRAWLVERFLAGPWFHFRDEDPRYLYYPPLRRPVAATTAIGYELDGDGTTLGLPVVGVCYVEALAYRLWLAGGSPGLGWELCGPPAPAGPAPCALESIVAVTDPRGRGPRNVFWPTGNVREFCSRDGATVAGIRAGDAATTSRPAEPFLREAFVGFRFCSTAKGEQ